MPYFKEIQLLAEQVSLWADLRHEQGADIGKEVRRVTRELDAARKRLQRVAAVDREREPDALHAIRRLRPRGPRKLANPALRGDFANRLRGAWLGRAAGCTLGVPVESWSVEDMEELAKLGSQPFPPEDYWAIHPKQNVVHHKVKRIKDYLRGHIAEVPVDDDLAYTQLGLLILERYGLGFTTANVAEMWLRHIPLAWTAEEVTLRNLRAGIVPEESGGVNNPYQEWIGADIRSDPWGYACAGWPERAAELAYRDAYLSHRGNGVYGAMLFAAAIAAAFAVDDPIDAIRVGLTEIPRDCRLARDVRWALRYAPKLKTFREARAAVEKRFAGMHHVHTNNNACLTVFGLQLGRGDFTKTIGACVAMGYDNDCTAATAGSILGAVIGIRRIPERWWKPFGNRASTYLKGVQAFRNDEMVRRFAAFTRQVWESG
ncbi:MAG: ADP-ribosylglycohydrolase family protein [Candidatus Hydrogenedentes bacterium]|nr:ADP-ribosylglycohydrolase family protein [Candidatus Hydrogenedentota bacterium]